MWAVINRKHSFNISHKLQEHILYMELTSTSADIKDFIFQYAKNFSENNIDSTTIYLQTSPVWDQNEEAKIQLKNYANDVDDYHRKFLAHLIDDEQFWKHVQDTLVIMMEKNQECVFTVSDEMGNQIHQDCAFYIKPLINILSRNYDYYLLLLSQKQVSLYRGREAKLFEINVPDMPINMDEIMEFDDPEKSIQNKTSSKTGPGLSGAMIYHGHGAYIDAKNDNLIRFCTSVDNAASQKISSQNTPLLIASDIKTYSIFSKLSKIKGILNQYVRLDKRSLHPDLLGKRAWEVMKEIQQQDINDEISQNLQKLEYEKSSRNSQEVLNKAYYGQVDTLLVRPEDELKVNIKMENGLLKAERINNGSNNNITELTNYTAINTLKNGGMVYSVENGKQLDSPLAAILRY